jgi:hypothetical protein
MMVKSDGQSLEQDSKVIEQGSQEAKSRRKHYQDVNFLYSSIIGNSFGKAFV